MTRHVTRHALVARDVTHSVTGLSLAPTTPHHTYYVLTSVFHRVGNFALPTYEGVGRHCGDKP